MKDGRYVCRESWHGQNVVDIVMDTKDCGNYYRFSLVSDKSSNGYGEVTRMFETHGKQGAMQFDKDSNLHGIMDRGDWFVLYPFKGGVPYLFEKEEDQ